MTGGGDMQIRLQGRRAGRFTKLYGKLDPRFVELRKIGSRGCLNSRGGREAHLGSSCGVPGVRRKDLG